MINEEVHVFSLAPVRADSWGAKSHQDGNSLYPYGSLIVGGFSEWSVSIEDEDRKHASYRNHSSYPRVKDGALPRI